MATASDEVVPWLPHKDIPKNGVKSDLDAALAFPSEFPYDFDSFLSSPPVESVAGSTEAESSDEEDFFAGLTRRLSQASIHDIRNHQLSVPISSSDKAEREKKARVLAGSPQSTLSGIGSWSVRSGGDSGDGSPEGVSRVPSPFSAANDAWEVIYAAAGQVARLKMNGEATKLDFQTRGVHGGVPHSFTSENRTTVSFSNPNLTQTYNHVPQVQYQQVMMQEQALKQHQCGSVWGRQEKPCNWSNQQRLQPQNRGYDGKYKCAGGSPQPGWPPLQAKQYQNQRVRHPGSGPRPGSQSGSGGVRRGCAGTGVFLPRQYGAPPPEPRKKTSTAPVVVPAKVIHALNLNIDEVNASTTQPRYSNAFGDYDALIARRNALLLQQQRLALLRREEAAASYEARLPQEWSY